MCVGLPSLTNMTIYNIEQNPTSSERIFPKLFAPLNHEIVRHSSECLMGAYFPRLQCSSHDESGTVIFLGGVAGVGKSSIGAKLKARRVQVIGSGDLLCQAAGISKADRVKFYKIDFRLYEQGMIDALSHTIIGLQESETLVYDTRYAVTSRDISNGKECWVPAMSPAHLTQILSIPGINVWNMLVEPPNEHDLFARREGDIKKSRPNSLDKIQRELIHTRSQFAEYTRIGCNAPNNPVRGIALITSHNGCDYYPTKIANEIIDFIR